MIRPDSAVGIGKEISASAVILYHSMSAIMLGVLRGVALWALGMRSSTALRSIVDTRDMNPDAELSKDET